MWSPTLLTSLIWSLVIYSCFWHWSHMYKVSVSSMLHKIRNSCWPSHMWFQEVSTNSASLVAETQDLLYKFRRGLHWGTSVTDKKKGQCIFRYELGLGTSEYVLFCVCVRAGGRAHMKSIVIWGAQTPGNVNFVWWCLIFLGHQYGTCIISLLWHLQFSRDF
jgi:hypothetical protein